MNGGTPSLRRAFPAAMAAIAIIFLASAGCGQTQPAKPSLTDKDFSGSLDQKASLLQQDISQAGAVIDKVAAPSPDDQPSAQDEAGALAQLQALEQKLAADDAAKLAPPPADCHACATAADKVRRNADQALVLLKQSEAPLSLLQATQAVHEDEYNELKQVSLPPLKSPTQTISGQDMYSLVDAKREAHEHAVGAWQNLRPQAAGDAIAKTALEKVISDEQAVVAAYQATGYSGDSEQIVQAESDATTAFDELQKVIRSELEAGKGQLTGLQANIGSAVSGLPR